MNKPQEQLLCRAKRTDNGEWVEGYYSRIPKKRGIQRILIDPTKMDVIVDKNGKYAEVYPETVCRCIGEMDKNGKMIFEGDIDDPDGTGEYMVVTYQNAAYRLVWPDGEGFDLCISWELTSIVGNRFDNPEMMEVKDGS